MASAARAILHVDMDAFYASVEERDNPQLKGKPLIVGGTSGRGVVAAASYAVRRYGVHSAMPITEALRRCPHAICVKPRMSRYQEVSAQIFALFREITPLVEGLSLDEAFLDVTASQALLGNAETIGHEIRRRIVGVTGLTASVGIAPNKLVAKIASDLNKPDGLYCVAADQMQAVLDPLPVERLFGIGRKSLPAVHAAGIRTFRELRQADDARVWRAFGKFGKIMRARAAGIDDRPVTASREEKSVSAEETFAVDIKDRAQLLAQLLALADRTAARLRGHDLVAATVAIKIRRADFTTYTRQRSLDAPTQQSAQIGRVAQQLLMEWIVKQPTASVRLLGVGAGNLEAAASHRSQPDLFDVGPGKDARLDSTLDHIRERFGSRLVTRASLLPNGPGNRTGNRNG